MKEPVKYEAATQPGLFFWAEEHKQELPGGRLQKTSYLVVAQADGYPPSEVLDDWFVHEKEADAFAKYCARFYPNH